MTLQFHQGIEDDISPIFDQAKQLIDAYEDCAHIAYDQVLAWVSAKIKENISAYCRVTLDGQTCAYYRLCSDGEVDDLYVLSSFRGRGIGTAILEKCIAESKAPLYLYCFVNNQPALSLYRRFGFAVAEQVSHTRVILRRNG